MKKQLKLLLVIMVAFFIGLVVMSFFWRDDNTYKNAYTPMVEKSLERQKENSQERDEDSSVEPHAPGFREKDIDRQHGDRFSTY